ncbi:MAG: hypothetical protein AMXMBFR7_46030 [Planctomycetota bacterium]
MVISEHTSVPHAQQQNIAALWDVKACAHFLKRSPRWVYAALTCKPNAPGSIPHVRIGKAPRFIPADLQAWVRMGCPPTATFQQWSQAQPRRNRRQ